MANGLNLKEYAQFLNVLKERVVSARYKAVQYVNKELIHLYHYIGSEIIKKQAVHGWGAKIIEKLSCDLRAEFPDMKGFSPQNLKYMRRFAEEYTLEEISQQAIDQLPWGHNITIMYWVSDKKEREFYIQQARTHGWSRNILSMQIETNLYKREGNAMTNFRVKLSSPYSELAQATLKSPYLFDFLSLGKDAHEREIEKALVTHIEKFLLELGEGFAFLGRQYHIQVENSDYYIDLLFYHIRLRSFVIVEIKTGEFRPEYIGKINFYLSAIDELVKHISDNPSIGLILCKTKSSVTAEYALRDMTKPIGLAEYKLTGNLPENIKTSLPTIKELEEELSKQFNE